MQLNIADVTVYGSPPPPPGAASPPPPSTCGPGLVSKDGACVDLDECATGWHTCDPLVATGCANQPDGKGYTCTCNAWAVQLAPQVCKPVNPCDAQPCGGAPNVCFRDVTATAGYRCECGNGWSPKVSKYGRPACYGNVATGKSCSSTGNGEPDNVAVRSEECSRAVDGDMSTTATMMRMTYYTWISVDLGTMHYIDRWQMWGDDSLYFKLERPAAGLDETYNKQPYQWRGPATVAGFTGVGKMEPGPGTWTPPERGGRYFMFFNNKMGTTTSGVPQFNDFAVKEIVLLGYTLGDACAGSPCGPGSCSSYLTNEGVPRYTCACSGGARKVYAGTMAETCIAFDSCEDSPCGDGSCTGGGGGYSCECQAPYWRKRFAGEPEYCSDNSQNPAPTALKYCRPGTHNPCTCPAGYTRVHVGTLSETCGDVDECMMPVYKSRCQAEGKMCVNTQGGYYCAAPPPPPPSPPGIAKVTSSFSAGFSDISLSLDGNISPTLLRQFVDNFKMGIFRSTGTPLNDIIVTTVVVNGVPVAVPAPLLSDPTPGARRRRAALETLTAGERRDLLQPSGGAAAATPLRDGAAAIAAAASALGVGGAKLNSLEAVGPTLPTSAELLESLHEVERALLTALESPEFLAAAALAPHRSLADGDQASVGFQMSQDIAVPLPPSPPPAPPLQPGANELPGVPPSPPRPPLSPTISAAALMSSVSSAVGASAAVQQQPNMPPDPPATPPGPITYRLAAHGFAAPVATRFVAAFAAAAFTATALALATFTATAFAAAAFTSAASTAITSAFTSAIATTTFTPTSAAPVLTASTAAAANGVIPTAAAANPITTFTATTPTIPACTASSSAPIFATSDASLVTGAPAREVLRMKSCRVPALALGWGPGIKAGPRFLNVTFPAGPTGGSVAALSLYLVNIGKLDPLVTAVTLAVVPVGKTAAVLVPLYNATTASQPLDLACPGITRLPFDVVATARPTGLSLAQLRSAAVVGARIDFNGTPVAKPAGLPYVAAVGLELGATASA
ncbi:hypothetical protein GPECTOR_4g920 [Gonium pectorale]|uniref:EGF-like domain-containing protein n=1 Tax=Gonium pectorale TaxID=33097 RepID=A0A150GYU4_GONPE|nr:hypothetical protein GPECTOR_4g920 [Gonium pectorale]|eukprot:KXZ54848.1 hypothetical protein GPECTOR_4g920 [Gonium pectorale]